MVFGTSGAKVNFFGNYSGSECNFTKDKIHKMLISKNHREEKLIDPTRMGSEPTRAEPNGLAAHRLKHRPPRRVHLEK